MYSRFIDYRYYIYAIKLEDHISLFQRLCGRPVLGGLQRSQRQDVRSLGPCLDQKLDDPQLSVRGINKQSPDIAGGVHVGKDFRGFLMLFGSD